MDHRIRLFSILYPRFFSLCPKSQQTHPSGIGTLPTCAAVHKIYLPFPPKLLPFLSAVKPPAFTDESSGVKALEVRRVTHPPRAARTRASNASPWAIGPRIAEASILRGRHPGPM